MAWTQLKECIAPPHLCILHKGYDAGHNKPNINLFNEYKSRLDREQELLDNELGTEPQHVKRGSYQLSRFPLTHHHALTLAFKFIINYMIENVKLENDGHI